MTPSPLSDANDANDTTVARDPDAELGDGLALLDAAEYSGDWKAVAEWLMRNPQHAPALAENAKRADAFRAALPVAADALGPGTRVGKYALGEKLGEGGMGVVYSARHLELNHPCAVKVLRADNGFTPMDVARFREEAQVVASLNHPNVVSVSDSGEMNARPYLVMQLMAGSLADWLKRQPDRRADAKKAAAFVRDVALGVHHAHQRGLIHRDLKPGNVLLDAENVPHVADFGLARRIDATTTVGVAGTWAYMAPEQARGEKGLSTAVDVYALGVVLFELLAGRVPYPAAEVLSRLLDEHEPVPSVREFRPDVPADLAAICAKCLEKRPGDRYRSAQELADDLDNYLNDRPVTAQPPGFWDWLRQLARIRPTDSYANTFWPVTAWFGLIFLVTKVCIYSMVRSDAAAAWVWVATMVEGAAELVVLWWYMLRRFRLVSRIDRDSLVIAVGGVLLYVPLMVAFVPMSLSRPAREGMGLFPPYAALLGLALFVLGSTHWSRFFLLGLAVMALVPILARWPEESPLVFGLTLAAVMWYWSCASGRQGHRNRTADPSPPVA